MGTAVSAPYFNLHCDLGLETQSKGTSVYRVVTPSMPTHW